MAFIRNLGGLAAFALTLTAACGDNLKPPAEDAAPPPIDAPRRSAATAWSRAARTCDDGDQVADAVCGATCRFTCGNGVVDEGFGELCDTGIASRAPARARPRATTAWLVPPDVLAGRVARRNV
jgi:hypothetical protein